MMIFVYFSYRVSADGGTCLLREYLCQAGQKKSCISGSQNKSLLHKHDQKSNFKIYFSTNIAVIRSD